MGSVGEWCRLAVYVRKGLELVLVGSVGEWCRLAVYVWKGLELVLSGMLSQNLNFCSLFKTYEW